MANSLHSHPYKIVVFDLGGVLAQISHTWEEAARQSGVKTSLDPAGATPLAHPVPIDDYQKGAMELDAYLDALSAWSQCDRADAEALHNGIIIEEYPGVHDLVEEVQAAGFRTGCLSNTNAPHWVELTGERFPAIARLEHKMASHLVAINKPDHAIYQLYADTHGVRPEEVVFFDDGVGNVEAAREVGFSAKRIDPTGDTAAQMREYLVELGILPVSSGA